MTTFYAAARYRLDVPKGEQWHDLSDLTTVAVELVRIGRALGKSLEDVISVFEEGISQAEYVWDETAGSPEAGS